MKNRETTVRRKADRIFWISFTTCALYTAIAGSGVLYGLDYAIIVASQNFASGFLDAVGNAFSLLGDVEVTTVSFGLLCIALFFAVDRWLAVRLVASYTVASLVELLMKFLVPVPVLPSELGRTGDYDPTIEVAYNYPYPSGHMLRIMFVLGTVYVLWPNRAARFVIVVLLVLMAASRVYLGVHWPSDIIGGVLIGLAGLAWAFRTYRPKRVKGQTS